MGRRPAGILTSPRRRSAAGDGTGDAGKRPQRRIWVRLRRVLAVMPVMGALGAVPLVNPGLGADELAVYPSAGTQTASPTSQISFRGATQPLVVTVTGSSSGDHSGHFADHSDGNGTSFIPDKPFNNDETVTVKVVGHTLV